MPNPVCLLTPLSRELARSLHIGQRLLLHGSLLAARDAAHQRLVACLDRGEALPVDLTNQIIYYVGPSPARKGQAIGSAGPTTAGRMDRYTPRLLEAGVTGMIGKGNRDQAVFAAMNQYGAVYLAATGGAGALLSRCIRRYTVLAWPELGTEALARLEVENFPVIVAGDAEGRDLYREGPLPYTSC